MTINAQQGCNEPSLQRIQCSLFSRVFSPLQAETRGGSCTDCSEPHKMHCNMCTTRAYGLACPCIFYCYKFDPKPAKFKSVLHINPGLYRLLLSLY